VIEWRFLGDSERYLLYSELCFIPDDFDDKNIAVGNTTRSVCRKLCSKSYSEQCSAFLYDRRSNNCTLTPFTGEVVKGDGAISRLKQGCEESTLEFYRRVRRLGT